MQNRPTYNLKNCGLFNGMAEKEINKVIDKSVNQSYKNGETLCKQGDQGDCMFIILTGRVQIQLTGQDNKKQKLNVLNHGDHFGELALLTESVRSATVLAIMDTAVLIIYKDNFKKLLHEIPLFSINLSNTISSWLQGALSQKPARHKMRVSALVRTASNTDNFSHQIINWVTNHKGKSVDVFTDQKENWLKKTKTDFHKHLHEISPDPAQIHDTIKKIAELEKDHHRDHVFIELEITSNTNLDEAKNLLNQCEHVWLLAKYTDHKSTNRLVSWLVDKQSLLLMRLQRVWIQEQNTAKSPENITLQNLSNTHTRDSEFSDMYCQYDPKTKQLRNQDLSKFYHQIMGVHIGLALSGGGARSLAHIGVLAALNENGIYVDRFAGTSGGAIISAFYAAGFNYSYILKVFEDEMSPPKWMRFIPHSSKWYLMMLFRFGLLEQRFQRYLKDYKIEQLLMPVHLVCADLISGNEIIRSEGDVVESILESINHPLLGKPIFQDGMSLVDGGVLNNVPSSVLRENRCDFVISVDIGAKISKQFGENNKNTPKSKMKHTNFLATINRVLEIREHSLDQKGKKHSDFVIEPDVSMYPFEDFTHGKALYEIGYKATMKIMPELKKQYNEHIEVE